MLCGVIQLLTDEFLQFAFRDQGPRADFYHPKFGKIPHLANPIRYSQSKIVPIGISPQLGEHNFNILESLGYTEAQIHDFDNLRCFGRKKKI